EAAVARIENHERAGVARFGRAVVIDLGGLGPPRPALEREVAHEGLAVDRDEIEHQAGGLTIDGFQREGLVHPDRTRGVDDDPRAALHHQAEAERLDHPAATLAGPWRQLE